MNMINNSHTAQRDIAGRVKQTLLYVALMAMVFNASLASAAQAVATVSKNIVAVNEVFQLTISIDDNVSTSALDLSALKKDFSYSRPSVSSGTSMINGVISRKTEWTISLATKDVGEFTIPSFRIGATTTDPIVVTSLKSSNNSSQASAKPEVRVDYEIEKKQLYIGESVGYTVRIRIGEQMSQASLIAPSGDGLEVKQNGEDRQAETVLNGRRYFIITRDYQITATKAGTIQLQGARFRGEVVKGNRGFSPGLRIPVDLSTDDLELKIQDKPSGYRGLWLPTADLQLEQEWQPESQEIRVGEPITRTITLRIKNAEQSSMPNLSLEYPDTVKVYDEKPVYSNANGYSIMTLKQVILPRSEGELALPPLSVNWWNTLSSQQETSRIEGLKLTVLPGEGTNSLALPALPVLNSTSPGQPTPAEVQVITDAGWWPWLTALFAALWLATLLLLGKLWLQIRALRHPNNHDQSNRLATVSPITGMTAAAKKKQAIQVQAFYRQWADENPDHSLLEPLYREVNKMMAAHFSKQPESWDNTDLLELLGQITQVSRNTTGKTKAKGPALAPLIPGN